ncbi:MAG: nickel-dependent lactate racemase [Deltaproteobacteria bacterium]|nr:nickel-dependent lactate racemase [Deltaproteobacteria bacterium]
MRLRLDYGSEGLDVDLPDERVTVVEPSFLPAIDNPHAALIAALRAPTERLPLRDIVRPGQKIAISVCDITRPQPRQAMLRAILEEMHGINPHDLTILIATGTHRTNTSAEIERMLGYNIFANSTVINHDSRDDLSLAYLGDTKTGAPIYLNRKWLAADVRITTGFVEPHFFAGFSGGAKMVAPGLAGLKTVLMLHDAKRIGSPKATWGAIDGNPVQDDIREIARTTGVTFSIDVTLNRDQSITAVFAGELFAEHGQACMFSKKSVMCPVDSAFDVVLTTNSGYPLDQNLYQAVKGMSAAAKVVKPGGTIVCAAECRDGLPSHGSYGELLASRRTAAELLEMINAPGFSCPDAWQVQVQAQILMKAKVLVKNSFMTDAEVRAAHFEPVHDVGEAVSAALKAAGPAATLCVLPQGPQTIPYLR